MTLNLLLVTVSGSLIPTSTQAGYALQVVPLTPADTAATAATAVFAVSALAAPQLLSAWKGPLNSIQPVPDT